MDFTLLRLEAGFAAAVRTMCLAHGHMDLASHWQHQLQDPDRAMPCAAGLRVRVDFALATETYDTITATEPPGSLVTMMASMMDGQVEAALEAISPALRAGIVSLFQHGTAEEIVVAAPRRCVSTWSEMYLAIEHVKERVTINDVRKWCVFMITDVVSTEATETGTRRETGSCRPKWSPIPTIAVTWIPVSEPRGKLPSGHLSGVGFGWYLARISLQLVPACWCSYPLVVRRDFAFFLCVFSVCSLRFFT